MTGFTQPGRSRVEAALVSEGRGWIRAALFDLGPYPAAVPDHASRVWGEIYSMLDHDAVLRVLDDIESYQPAHPDTSLYARLETTVTFEDGRTAAAWAYFYNRPLGRAARIESGDYRAYVKGKSAGAKRPGGRP